MATERPISDEAFRGLTLLTLSSRGVYAFIEPALIEAMADCGWCTPAGEITRAGEDAFVEGQKARVRRGREDGAGPASAGASAGASARRNPTDRRPFR